MMFTLEQIETAHGKVKTGTDFPTYIKLLKTLGVQSYIVAVLDGRTVYIAEDGSSLLSEPRYPEINITDESDAVQFMKYLENHQQGKTLQSL